MKKEDNMQKSPKYIIGDLVYIDGKAREITAINDSGQYHIKVEDATAIIEPKEVTPIPLTPEILEKNGWKKIDIMPFPTYAKGTTLEYGLFLNKDAWCFKYNGRMLPVEIKYIHQLQHLLFGLGLNNNMIV